jgi:hypothetical protein
MDDAKANIYALFWFCISVSVILIVFGLALFLLDLPLKNSYLFGMPFNLVLYATNLIFGFVFLAK